MSDAVAVPPEETVAEEPQVPTRRLLVFEIAGNGYACEMDAFREIVPNQEMTRLPGAPDTVCGLINLRGTIVTVIDGGTALGKPAVEKYQQLKPDLVTMDIIMPEMGGIEAVKQITQLDPAARILMCSAMGQQALVQEALQAGARDFVVKPFQPSRVLEAVQRVLA